MLLFFFIYYELLFPFLYNFEAFLVTHFVIGLNNLIMGLLCIPRWLLNEPYFSSIPGCFVVRSSLPAPCDVSAGWEPAPDSPSLPLYYISYIFFYLAITPSSILFREKDTRHLEKSAPIAYLY